MRFCSVSRRALLAISILVSVLLLGLASESQAVDRLRVTVGDTTGYPGQENSVITVFLTNTSDAIRAFTVHLILNRNDVANFQTNLDTALDTTFWRCVGYDGLGKCNDSEAVDSPYIYPWDMMHVDSTPVNVGSLDTVGTLISGWESVESRSVYTGGLGLDIKVTAYAYQNGYHPPLYPQQGGVLFRLRADIFPIPPEMIDRSVGILVDVGNKPYFGFSTPAGVSIGWIQVPKPDTSYYMCTAPVPPPGSGCYTWTKKHSWECPTGGCDSVGIDTIYVATLDTANVKIYDGQLQVLDFMCGDCNNSASVTIGDISVLIDHLFITGVALDPIAPCDANCSGDITIGDVMALIDRLFVSGSPLCCEAR